MSARVAAVSYGTQGTVAYDPCSGVTIRLHRIPIGSRRQVIADADLAASAIVHPAMLARAWPVSVCWSPIVACNLNCPHCLDDKAVLALGALERRRIAGLLASSGVLGVDMSGGEPLLLPDLTQLLTILREGDLAVSVTTNGWHLEGLADRLVDHVDAVRVSLDGATTSTHDRWRGIGSFSRALAGMSAAVRSGIPLQVQTVLMRDTIGSLQGIADLAANYGARGLTALQMLPIGEGSALAPEQALTDAEAAALVDAVAAQVSLPVRLRRRDSAEGFTVVRADGRVWQNTSGATDILPLRPFYRAEDLLLSDRDGSA